MNTVFVLTQISHTGSRATVEIKGVYASMEGGSKEAGSIAVAYRFKLDRTYAELNMVRIEWRDEKGLPALQLSERTLHP